MVEHRDMAHGAKSKKNLNLEKNTMFIYLNMGLFHYNRTTSLNRTESPHSIPR